MTDSVPQVDDYAASVGTTGRVTVGSATGEIGGTLAADTLAGTAGADVIDGLAGNDTVRGLGGDDRLWGRQGADTLYGNAGNDRLWGGRDGDELHGGVGKDHLYGGLGHDTLYGGRGDDTLNGGRLADRLHGGEGKDVLVGGHGRDLFVYDDADFGRDRIVDFEDGVDRLDFTGSGLRWSDLSVSNNGKGDAVVRVDGANGKIVLEGVDASLIGQDDFIFPETPATAMTPPVVARAPVFGQQGYAFPLAENADGSGSRVALGTVSATDPEGSTVSYSIAGGNAAGLFEIDASTGALYYTGSGEDYEAGPTSRELTVRASDGALHADVTVTVALADAAEAPVFGQQGYAFSLAENADGSGSRVALGTVSATDPEGSTVSYSIAGGNAAGLFEIDASTGALYYTGSGEDYEAGPTSRELTVRASDGALHADVTVTVTVTDVEEEAVTPARAPQQSVSEAAGEDLPADSTTTGVVAVDGAATGNIGITGDRDWFAVEFEAGRSYQIDLKGRPTGDGTLRDPELFGIHDAEGNLISGTTDSNGGEGRNSRETFTATESGTHYIAAGGRAIWAGPAYGQGTYEVAVTDLGQNRSEAAGEDLPAGSTTTGVVVVGGEATGKIGRAGDRDWFAVEFEAGRTYDIVLKGSPTGDGTLHDPHLFGIHDVDGNLVPRTTSSHGGYTADSNSRVIFTAGETDTHYIEAGGFRNYWGTYTLAVADITDEYPDDFAHTTTTTGTVSVGGSVTGEFQWFPFPYASSDEDWFAVEFEEGKTYRIDLEGASTNAGTVPNPYISGVFDADGNLLYDSTDFNGGEGLNSRLIFTAGETATHYISAQAYRDEGTYKLSVTDISDQVTDDFAFGTGTSGTVSVDGSVTGKIERARDQDWFAVELEAGKTYRVDLEGVWSDVGTLPDPYLRGIFDSDGVLIPGTSDDDSGFKDNSRVTFTATETGTHYVAASAFRVSHRETEHNAYRLSVYDVTDGGGPDEFTAGTDTTGRVSVGGSATGLIGYVGDRDWFAVELVAGETYRIDLKGWEADGWLIDPYLHGIHDAAGNLISGTEDDNGGAQLNSRVTFEATDTGTYYIAAGSGPWKSHAYGEGTYTLSVELWDAF